MNPFTTFITFCLDCTNSLLRRYHDTGVTAFASYFLFSYCLHILLCFVGGRDGRYGAQGIQAADMENCLYRRKKASVAGGFFEELAGITSRMDWETNVENRLHVEVGKVG